MGRTGQGLQQGNWFNNHWRAIVTVLIIVTIVLIGGYYLITEVIGCGEAKAPAEEATVTMTSPKPDESIQNFYQINLTVSDEKQVKAVKVNVEDQNGREIKGKSSRSGTEIIWAPNSPLVDPGGYKVLISGKNIKLDTFAFFIGEAKKEEQKKIEPPPPPVVPGTPGTKSERSKTLDELANKYPVQP